MHQIMTHVYLTVSKRPSYMESLVVFLQVPPPQTEFSHISPQNISFLFPAHYFFIITLKKIDK